MIRKRALTYGEKLLQNKGFREGVEMEIAKLQISEEIARVRLEAHLTQQALAKKIKSSKTAISRYESGNYNRYSIPLLRRIANACGTELRIGFVHKKQRKKHEFRGQHT